jgi:dihydropteroate synthase
MEPSLTEQTRKHWSCGPHNLPVGGRPLVAGILNVTPDSFYDGGRYCDPDLAAERAFEMAAEGADLIDIGGQSSRPFSDPVTPEEELGRVAPVLDRLEGKIGVPVSIDTYDARVAQYAVFHGASIVNDITAMTCDPRMAPLVAREKVGVVLMHMRGTPKTMQTDTHYDDILHEVKSCLAEWVEVARNAGIPRDAIAIDPGIGFGKSPEGNLEILRRLTELKELGYPVLVGASRKSFIGNVLDVPEEDRLEGSLGAACAAVMNGADIVRVHDVRETVRAVGMVDAIRREGNESCRR